MPHISVSSIASLNELLFIFAKGMPGTMCHIAARPLPNESGLREGSVFQISNNAVHSIFS
jgi:hypothetical protein